MCACSVRSHVIGPMVVCIAATISGAYPGMPARAAEDSTELPRYRLKLGQELQFHTQSEFKSAKKSGANGDTTDWQVWVARTNGDGSWRIIVRANEKTWQDSGDGKGRTEQPADNKLISFDLFPDGRVTPIEPAELLQDQPGKLFPLLPPDRESAKKGWTLEAEEGFMRCDYAADPQQNNADQWTFDRVLHRAWDKIYDASTRTKFTFDLKRGLTQQAETELTWGNGFDEKGTETQTFVAVVDHDEAWTNSFAAEADRYFAATRAYRDLGRVAGRDPDQCEALLARAEHELTSARDASKQAVFTQQLNQQLERHKQQAKWTIQGAKEIAEIKGKPAPEWKLDDLDGKSHSLADYRGKVVVLDFWYRGCGWCVRAMPQIEQLSRDFKDQPVAVLGMNNDQDEKDARFVVDAMQLTYPVLKGTEIPAKYKVHGFPTLIIIDQDGNVHDVHIGYSKTLRADIAKIVKDLLAQGPKAKTAAANVPR